MALLPQFHVHLFWNGGCVLAHLLAVIQHARCAALLQELDLSCNQLVSLPAGLSHLVSLTSLQLQHNQLETLPVQITSLQQLALLDVSHNWLSGFNKTPHWGQLVSGWQQLRVLKLANVSDKRGALVFPSQLGACSVLSELAVGHNHSVDWSSMELLLDKCAVRALQAA